MNGHSSKLLNQLNRLLQYYRSWVYERAPCRHTHAQHWKQIRVNSANPTVVMTSMGRMAWSDPVKSGPVLDRIPLGRFVEVCIGSREAWWWVGGGVS